jgi:hypothetical protein
MVVVALSACNLAPGYGTQEPSGGSGSLTVTYTDDAGEHSVDVELPELVCDGDGSLLLVSSPDPTPQLNVVFSPEAVWTIDLVLPDGDLRFTSSGSPGDSDSPVRADTSLEIAGAKGKVFEWDGENSTPVDDDASLAGSLSCAR